MADADLWALCRSPWKKTKLLLSTFVSLSQQKQNQFIRCGEILPQETSSSKAVFPSLESWICTSKSPLLKTVPEQVFQASFQFLLLFATYLYAHLLWEGTTPDRVDRARPIAAPAPLFHLYLSHPSMNTLNLPSRDIQTTSPHTQLVASTQENQQKKSKPRKEVPLPLSAKGLLEQFNTGLKTNLHESQIFSSTLRLLSKGLLHFRDCNDQKGSPCCESATQSGHQ